MRRLFTLVVVLLVFVAANSVAAQESRPGADEAPLPDGVTFEHLAQTQIRYRPSTPAVVALVRITLAPSATLPLEADDPLALVEVESGTWTVSVPASVNSREVDGTVVTEVSADRVEMDFPPGDGTEFPLPFGGEVRNDGLVPAVAILLIIQSDIAEATPGATPSATAALFAEGSEGVTVQRLASGRIEELPKGVVALVVGRLTFEPGAVIPAHFQCGGHAGFVETGNLSFRAVDGSTLEVRRGSGIATPSTGFGQTVETVGPGIDTTLGPGDAVFVPTGSVCEVRTVGDEPAVILAAFIDPQ